MKEKHFMSLDDKRALAVIKLLGVFLQQLSVACFGVGIFQATKLGVSLGISSFLASAVIAYLTEDLV